MTLSEDEDGASKVERLALSAAVAPFVRETAAVARSRRVGVLDKGGNVTRYVTWADVQAAQLKRHALEIDVQDGQRPKEALCSLCGLPFPVARKGVVGRVCKPCLRLQCEICGGPIKSRRRMSASRPQLKTCGSCRMHPERAAEMGRRGQAARRERAPRARSPVRARDSCINGHSMSDENTLIRPSNGQRECRACKKEAADRYRQKKRAKTVQARTKHDTSAE